jgi:hypothetical protein
VPTISQVEPQVSLCALYCTSISSWSSCDHEFRSCSPPARPVDRTGEDHVGLQHRPRRAAPRPRRARAPREREVRRPSRQRPARRAFREARPDRTSRRSRGERRAGDPSRRRSPAREREPEPRPEPRRSPGSRGQACRAALPRSKATTAREPEWPACGRCTGDDGPEGPPGGNMPPGRAVAGARAHAPSRDSGGGLRVLCRANARVVPCVPCACPHHASHPAHVPGYRGDRATFRPGGGCPWGRTPAAVPSGAVTSRPGGDGQGSSPIRLPVVHPLAGLTPADWMASPPSRGGVVPAMVRGGAIRFPGLYLTRAPAGGARYPPQGRPGGLPWSRPGGRRVEPLTGAAGGSLVAFERPGPAGSPRGERAPQVGGQGSRAAAVRDGGDPWGSWLHTRPGGYPGGRFRLRMGGVSVAHGRSPGVAVAWCPWSPRLHSSAGAGEGPGGRAPRVRGQGGKAEPSTPDPGPWGAGTGPAPPGRGGYRLPPLRPWPRRVLTT